MIKCKICGKKLKQLTTSGHLRRHNMTRESYLEKFPGADTVCKETRSAHSKSIKKRVRRGDHFVPFRDVKGLARKTHDKYMTGPVSFTCIRCGKVKKTNQYAAERRKFCTNKCHSQHIVENPELYVERNKKISQSNKGIVKKGQPYSRCNGGYRDDIGHYVRSGWEADVCRIFKYNNKPYDYEAYTVILQDGKDTLTWIFDLVDTKNFMSKGLVEVKGWWDDKSKKKARLLKKQRPDLYNKLTFIDQKRMMELVQQYRDIIPYWETRKLKHRRNSGHV